MTFQDIAVDLTELSQSPYSLGGAREYGVMKMGGAREYGVMKMGGPREFGVMTPASPLGKAA
ncbi:MAG: hypothetical protein AB1511_07490 [Deinococcota bacterium]